MSALIKYAIALAPVLSVVYVYQSLGDRDGAVRHAKSRPPAGPVTPAGPASKADIDEELDYLVARRIGSLEGWRAFLAAHGAGSYAESARAEIEKLLPADNSTALSAEKEAPTAEKESNGASPDAKADTDAVTLAPPSPMAEVASLASKEICKRDEYHLARLRESPSSEEVARFAEELGCEKLRPQVLSLIEDLDYLVARRIGSLEGWRTFLAAHGAGSYARSATAEIEKMLAADNSRPTAEKEVGEVASIASEEICKRDEDRLARLRESPSSEELARFTKELGCVKLRPQLLGLMESRSRAASAQPSAEPPIRASADAFAESGSTGTAFTGDYVKGAAAYNRGDFATAKGVWLPLAERGDARAEFGLGLMYFLGQGVKVNIAAATEWCAKAADQGYAAAQYELGQIYQNPWYPELQDFDEARRWYTMAAEQNYARAQDELGAMYEFGLGVSRDYAAAEQWFSKAGDLTSIAKMYDEVAKSPSTAANWYRKLADQGDKYAMFRLGEMYRDGEGLAKNYASAHAWFSLAARSGYGHAATARDELAQKMSPEQIAAAQRLARERQPAN